MRGGGRAGAPDRLRVRLVRAPSPARRDDTSADRHAVAPLFSSIYRGKNRSWQGPCLYLAGALQMRGKRRRVGRTMSGGETTAVAHLFSPVHRGQTLSLPSVLCLRFATRGCALPDEWGQRNDQPCLHHLNASSVGQNKVAVMQAETPPLLAAGWTPRRRGASTCS